MWDHKNKIVFVIIVAKVAKVTKNPIALLVMKVLIEFQLVEQKVFVLVIQPMDITITV